MRTKAVRLYGKRDLRLEEFELPPIKENEILVKIVSDSICMSTYKAAEQGAGHKRVPNDVGKNPTIVGHEFCGEILEVGLKYKNRYSAGQKFTLQPAMKGTFSAAGYSFPYIGGDSEYGVIPECYIERDCVLLYEGESYFHGSVAEPVSCLIGAARSSYHTKQGVYAHEMGIREDGKTAALGACGPMGLALIDYLINCARKPSLLVVTDIDEARLKRAAELLPPEKAAKLGVRLIYENTNVRNPAALLKDISGGGFDDVFVLFPDSSLVEQADAILAYDGCLNFFSGPAYASFSAKINFYNVHYNAAHIVGSSGGNTDDMREALDYFASGKMDPAVMISHIGGLDAAAGATLNLPNIPGSKKLIYTHISMPLTAIADFKNMKGRIYEDLAGICVKNGGLWSAEAEKRLLEEFNQ